MRVVSRMEPLNLSREVLNGILCHTGAKKADTPEGRLIHYADRIAYVNHDLDDAVRAGLLQEQDIPEEVRSVLGTNHGARIDTLVHAVIDYGLCRKEIGMDPEIEHAMLALRQFLFARVYEEQGAEQNARAEWLLQALYEYYMIHFDRLPDTYQRMAEQGDRPARIVCDYVASMTDRYTISCYEEIFLPRSWNRT